MTDFHHSALDAHPDDSAARLLLAEYLDERGDPDAAGYRWMGQRAKRPYCNCWVNRHYAGDFGRHAAIPDELLHRLEGGQWDRFSRSVWVEFPTRRAAEQALCRAVSEVSNL